MTVNDAVMDAAAAVSAPNGKRNCLIDEFMLNENTALRPERSDQVNGQLTATYRVIRTGGTT